MSRTLVMMKFYFTFLELHFCSLIFKECPAFKNNNDFLLDNVVISNLTGESWFSRSLFVAGEHVFVCFEDLMQFRSLSVAASLPQYFSLDLCCSIADISELVMPLINCSSFP